MKNALGYTIADYHRAKPERILEPGPPPLWTKFLIAFAISAAGTMAFVKLAGLLG